MFSSKFKKELKIFITLVIVAFTVKGSVVEVYMVPTGSMEKEILVGDLLFGNKWMYGMRTPTWIGIPYTRFGFDIPWTRLPAFKELQRGDVTIFEYPRDPFQKYVKRCIGVPRDRIMIVLGDIFYIDDSSFNSDTLYSKSKYGVWGLSIQDSLIFQETRHIAKNTKGERLYAKNVKNLFCFNDIAALDSIMKIDIKIEIESLRDMRKYSEEELDKQNIDEAEKNIRREIKEYSEKDLKGIERDLVEIYSQVKKTIKDNNYQYEKMPFPENGQFIGKRVNDQFVKGLIFDSTFVDARLYPLFYGNQDNIRDFVVPFKGMEIDFSKEDNDWIHIISLLLQEGNIVELGSQTFVIKGDTVSTGERKFSMIDPVDIANTAGILRNKIKGLFGIKVNLAKEFDDYVRLAIRENLKSDIYNPWRIEVDQIYLRDTEFGRGNKSRERYFPDRDMVFDHNWIGKKSIFHYHTATKLADVDQFMIDNLRVNGVSIYDLGTYSLKYDYYFLMGDNRDNSSDSRFWGFVNENQILGTPVFSVINLAQFKLSLKLVD